MPSAHYVHPEFGYFCPTPRLRRKMRVALGCVVFGAIGIAMLRAGQDPNDPNSPNSGSALMARVDGGSGAETGPQAGQAPAIAALGLRPGLGQDLKTSCEQDTWAYLDGKCIAGKERKARVVRVTTNRPAIAAIPLGRGATPVASAAEPASSVAAASDGRKGDLSPSKAAQSAPAAASGAAAAVATEPAQQPVAASRKSQKTAHNQSRRRDHGRAEPSGVHGYASVPDNRYGPFGGFFGFLR
jgi:hypothetical protein